MSDWKYNVKPGSQLTPKPGWNNNTNKCNHLTNPTTILDVTKTQHCESGVLFQVKFVNDETAWLDANWFQPPK